MEKVDPKMEEISKLVTLSLMPHIKEGYAKGLNYEDALDFAFGEEIDRLDKLDNPAKGSVLVVYHALREANQKRRTESTPAQLTLPLL